jgi:TPR repeat protein
MKLFLLVVATFAVVLYLHEWHASNRYAERKAQLNSGTEALQLLAEEGDAEAMNRLGMDAWDKYGANSKEAVKWLCMARDRIRGRGYSDSAMLLGMTPCPVDGAPEVGNVMEWYKNAAENGNAKAHYHLACRYFLGEGLEMDKVAAYVHVKHAADLGFFLAEDDLYYRDRFWTDDEIIQGEERLTLAQHR